MEFQTERLLLRPWRDADAETLYQYAKDPEVGPRAGWKAHESVAESLQIIRTVLSEPETYAVCKDGEPIGSIGLFPTDQKALPMSEPELEIGYWIARPFWGQGLIPEAVRCLQEYVFRTLDKPVLWCACHDGNENSARVQRICGFRYHHTEKDRPNPALGDLRTTHFSRLTREEWEAGQKNLPPRPLCLAFQDTEWPFTYTGHDRLIVRAIVYDEAGYFYFVRAERHDDFGNATLIETSGGGVEPGESLRSAIVRELQEELGAEVEIVCRLGIVSDYYNLIHRHNLNHYYLCRLQSVGQKHLTEDEQEQFHLSTLKLRYDEAIEEYERRATTRIGRLIAQRELPILHRAGELLSGDDKQFRLLFQQTICKS